MSRAGGSIEAPWRTLGSRALSAWLLAAVLLAAAGRIDAQPAASGDVTTDLQAEADGSRTLSQSTVVSAPLPDVWQALTTSDGWRG